MKDDKAQIARLAHLLALADDLILDYIKTIEALNPMASLNYGRHIREEIKLELARLRPLTENKVDVP